MTHIIVEVEGGLVTAAWSTDRKIHLEVLNRDADESNDPEEHQEYIEDIEAKERDIKSMKMVDIYN